MNPRRAITILAASFALGSCVPWTVRPLENQTDQASAKFDARAYAGQAWVRIEAAIESSAVPVGDALKAPAGAAYVAVKGEARVLRVNRESRAGVAELDIEPFDGTTDVLLAIGPVIRGSAVRDATGIVTFNQFVNQLDYADVNNALNDRVLAVLAGVKLAPGATLSFMGVLTRGSGPPEVTPVRLRERPARACRPGSRPESRIHA